MNLSILKLLIRMHALVNVINNLKQLAESKDNVQDNSDGDSDSGNEGDNENTDHNENQADMSVLGLTTVVKQSKVLPGKTIKNYKEQNKACSR